MDGSKDILEEACETLELLFSKRFEYEALYKKLGHGNVPDLIDRLRWRIGEVDGGSAFPIGSGQTPQQGMTLRDYFAAAALTGEFASQEWNGVRWRPTDAGVVAEKCYTFADAMLAERDVERD